MTNAKMALAATVTCHLGDTGRLFCRCRFLRSNFQRSAASLFSCPAASQRKSFVTLPQRSHRRTLITTFHCGKKKQLKCAARRLVDYIFTFRNFLVLFIFRRKEIKALQTTDDADANSPIFSLVFMAPAARSFSLRLLIKRRK